jgi:predicted double-glycine peptidase/lysophospholipase L1-like esterase
MLWTVVALIALGGGAYWLSREGEFTTRRLPSDVKMGAVARVVLFLGDSLTASGYWQNVKLENATTAGRGWKGKTIAYVMGQAKALIESVSPTEVVLLAGVNNIQNKQSLDAIKDELLKAWAQIHDAGAKVWAVKLTPWFGYRLFENQQEGRKARDLTLAVNTFIDAMKGTPTGPDYVIDTAELGDEKGRLLKKYSWDKLHLIGKGYAKLAKIVQAALEKEGSQVQVGEQVFPALREVIERLKKKLAQSGVAPDSTKVPEGYELNFRTVTFVYKPESNGTASVKESIVKAGDLLPRYENVMDGAIEKLIYFKTRTEGRDLEASSTEEEDLYVTDVGAEIPQEVQPLLAELTERLTRNDAAPVNYRFEDVAGTQKQITFYFYTDFRAKRAGELLFPSYRARPYTVKIQTAVIAEAQVGEVVGTAQETPWTCGPAALRAVLAHYGINVEEGWLANLIGNVPVLGVRPPVLVEGARKLGCVATLGYFSDVNALRPFLANEVPVIVIVDSFLHPGKQGHYVVVTEVGADTVTLMDPHVEGNKRVLGHADFEQRWWNKEPGPDGQPRIAKHLAIVVVPGDKDWELEVGEDKPDSKTGRTAHIKVPPKALVAFTKVFQKITGAVVAFFTGPAGAKAYDALLSATHTDVSKMDNITRAKWFNGASNPDVYVWALGLARSQMLKYEEEAKKKDDKQFQANKAILGGLGVTSKSFDNIRTAMIPALKLHLCIYLKHKNGSNAHALQAILILFYGGLEDTWPIVKNAYEKRQKFDWKKPESAPEIAKWVEAVVAALEPYRKVPEGADNPLIEVDDEKREGKSSEAAPAKTYVGEWQAASQKVLLTARQVAALEKARTSQNPDDVLRAYYLAEAFRLEPLAKALQQRHMQMTGVRLKPEAQAVVVGAEVEAGKKGGPAKVVVELPGTEWMFLIEYLKQVWPLVASDRADTATLRRAVEVAESLDGDLAFMQNGDAEDTAFVRNALTELRQRSV